MQVRRLGRSVEVPGRELGPDEELAFVLASAMIPSLRAYRAARQAAAEELANAERVLATTEQQMAAATQASNALQARQAQERSALEHAERRLAEVDARPWKFFRWLWMLFFGKPWREERAAADRATSAARQALQATEAELGQQARLLSGHTLTRDGVRQDIGILRQRVESLAEVPRLVSGIRRLDYPLLPLTVHPGKYDARAGKGTPRTTLFVDPNGTARSLSVPSLTLPEADLTALELRLAEVDRDALPVMLDPGTGEELGRWGALYGSERALAESAELLVKLLSGYTRVDLDVSLVERESAAGEYLLEALEHLDGQEPVEAELDRATVGRTTQIEEIRGRLQALLTANKKIFDAAFGRLEGVPQFAVETTERMERARSEAAATTRVYLDRARANSRLARYHFFCPKCNATPPYLASEFQIRQKDIDEFHSSVLRERLGHYQDSCFGDAQGKKFSSEDVESVRDSWIHAFHVLADLERRHRDAAAEAGRGGRDAAKQQREMQVTRILYREIVRDLIRKPLVPWRERSREQSEIEVGQQGSSEFQVLNPNTRLTYDPQADWPWQCPLCEVRFRMDVAMLGAIDKIRHDIVYPMVTTLWNHESIWQQKVGLLKDIAREIRDRRVEEARALQAPIDQFLADARQTRLQLQQAYAKGEATSRRLDAIRLEFEAIGLLDKKELERVERAAASASAQIKRVDTELGEIDVRENDMQQTPREVFADRPLPLSPEKELVEKDSRRNLLAFAEAVQVVAMRADAPPSQPHGPALASEWQEPHASAGAEGPNVEPDAAPEAAELTEYCLECGQAYDDPAQRFCVTCGAPRPSAPLAAQPAPGRQGGES